MSAEEQAPLLGEEEDSTPPPSLSSRFRTALHSPSSLNGLEKFLALISIFLLLLTATGFGLFAGEAGKLGREERKHEGHKEGRVRTSTVERSVTMTRTSTVVTGGPTGTPEKNDAVCLTSTCVKVAARVINALDTSIDPCEDFYSFANGGWLEDNPVPEDLALFGVAQDLGNRNKRTILSILSEAPSTTLDSSDQTNLKHLRSFYASCLDEDLLDKEGSRPILDVVKAVLSAWRDKNSKSSLEDGSFNVQEEQEGGDLEYLTRKASKRDRLTSTLSYLHARGIPSLFEVYTDGDVAVDPKNMVLWLSQSGLGLPAKEYYHNKDVTSAYSEVIRHTLSNIYQELGERTDRIKEVSKEMLKFESELAKLSLNNEDLEDPVKSYNRRSAKAVQRLFPSISLANYIGAFNPRPAFPDPIIVTSPKYLEDLALLIEDAEEEVLEAYFVFRVAQQLGSLLGPKQTIRKEIQKLKNKLTGIADGTKEDRSDVCLTSLLENYGFLIGRYYILKAFTGDSKKYAEDVIEATIQAFKDRLPALDWLDEKSRKAAEEKASAITHKIGYPSTPDTLDPKSLERYYTPYLPISSSDFFGNVLRSRVADQMRLWTTVGKQRDLGVWEMVPSEVNAYYNPPANEIVFPAGILQSPYFSKDWPEYMVFGGFGCVAGHEISHAFDQSGRRYNKDGKLEDWWSNSTVANFEHLQSCIIDQYANYTVTDAKGTKYHIKSKFTNGEDMADAGGLGQSYQAWSKRFEEDPMGSKFQNYLLPGLNYTREQLFYITFAQGWALNARKDEAIRRILIDPHSPPNYRVLGPLSNDVNFSNAFGCKAGQPMSNVDKCKVW